MLLWLVLCLRLIYISSGFVTAPAQALRAPAPASATATLRDSAGSSSRDGSSPSSCDNLAQTPDGVFVRLGVFVCAYVSDHAGLIVWGICDWGGWRRLCACVWVSFDVQVFELWCVALGQALSAAFARALCVCLVKLPEQPLLQRQ